MSEINKMLLINHRLNKKIHYEKEILLSMKKNAELVSVIEEATTLIKKENIKILENLKHIKSIEIYRED